MFPFYFNRKLPYDPTRPFIDHDGKWYATISTDGCNGTHPPPGHKDQIICAAGGALDLWTSPKLHGTGANWKRVGLMIVTNATPIDNSVSAEFVTSNFFGAVPGDPRGGKTRVVINHQSKAGAGSPIFYLGVQSNGSRFEDASGNNDFAAPGEIGMLDWGAFAPNGVTGAKGLKALKGGQRAGLSMARTLGGDPNQVATAGRRTLVGSGAATYTFQTLLQDITLRKGAAGEAVVLNQQFIPELQMLRMDDRSAVATSQQFEVVAAISKPSTPAAGHGRVFFTVLQKGATKRSLSLAPTVRTCFQFNHSLKSRWSELTPCQCVWYLNLAVHIGVDFAAGLVFVDTTSAAPPGGSCHPNRAGCPPSGKSPPTPLRAGPLYGEASTPVHVHAIVDHCIIAVIFNNRTSLTISITPDEHDTGLRLPAVGVTADSWVLATANENTQKTPETPWLLPKIHNSPACLG